MTYGLDIQDSYAYIGDYQNGIAIYDVSDPSSPVSVGTIPLTGTVLSVLAADQFVCAANGTTLRVFDRTDPTELVELDPLIGVTNWMNFEYCPPYLTGIENPTSIKLFDFSDPSNITTVGSLSVPGGAHNTSTSDNIMCFSGIVEGLIIVDIEDPSVPTILGSYDPPENVTGVEKTGDIVYLSCWEMGIRVVDITDPVDPVQLVQIATDGSVENCTAVGNYLFVADGSAGVRVLDVSDPTNYIELLSYDTPERAFKIEVIDNIVFVCDVSSVIILEFDAGTDASELPNPTIPTKSTIESVFPNPFNSQTTVSIQLESDAPLLLSIYDLLGREVEVLADTDMQAGVHNISLDGNRLNSGVYFLRIQTPGSSDSIKKIAIIK